MVTDADCNKFNIPAHLHQLLKEKDSTFLNGEIFYRRVKRGEITKQPDGSKKISASVFSTRNGLSCNRSKYCQLPEDVLYNIIDGNHYLNDGIAIIQIPAIDSFHSLIFEHPNMDDKTYQILITHEPEKCMYPHTQFNVLENGKIVDDISPKSVKTLIKDEIKMYSTIIKDPAE